MCTKRNILTVTLAAAILLLTAIPARPATEAEITDAINDGITWLVANQNDDGSWGGNSQVALTGLAVVKLQDRDRELGTSNYVNEIQAGLDYIFSQATIVPDTYVSWYDETYYTGIAMMAIANDGVLTQTVVGGPLDGLTYAQVLNGSVNYFVMSQSVANGGWGYDFWSGDWTDQSNTGYAVLGLSYANNAGIDTSGVNGGLLTWVNSIQAADGGAQYTIGGGWQNELKTGNLLFQMSFLGIGPGDSRFDAAIDYIELHWQDGNMDPGWGYSGGLNDYQAMYCLMKGLQSSGVDEIDTDGDSVLEDWFNQEPPSVTPQDLASHIVATKNLGGSWTDNNWGQYVDPEVLGTVWALLTLEKVTVIHHKFAIDIKPGSCPNPFNGKIEGSVPVAIIGAEGLDVTTIDPTSLKLNGVSIVPGNVLIADVTQPGDYDPTDCSACFDEDDWLTDIDGDDIGDIYLGDGFPDLVVKFGAQALATAIGPQNRDACVVLTLTGETDAGVSFEASDSMIIRTKIK